MIATRTSNLLLKKYLYTRSGVGGYSIDVRADNGYIVAQPSSINGNAYEITNYADIANIPETLANFLKGLDDEKDRDKAEKLNNKNESKGRRYTR